MRVTVAMVAALCALSARAAEVRPLHAWDFDACDKNGRTEDRGASDRRFWLYGTVAAGQGVGATSGLLVSFAGKSSVADFPVDAADVTVDMKFRLSAALDGKTPRTLWYYSWDAWAHGRWMAFVTGDGRLCVSVRQAAKKGPFASTDMQAVSQVLGIAAGRYHALRVQVSGGTVSAWLDGELVLKKEGFPAWNAFRPASYSKWYPLFRIGVDDDHSSGPGRAFLDGTADDVAIYDRALGAPDLFAKSADYSGVPRPEFRADDAADDAADILLIDAKGAARTRRFRVLDHEEGALGLMKRADSRFVDNAARASFRLVGEKIVVTIACPVPAGLTVEKSTGNAWRGDGVEVFIRPSWEDTVYFQYSANAAGVFSAKRCTAPHVADAAWHSGATAKAKETDRGFAVAFEIPKKEVFGRPLEAGDAFGVNFVRAGKTCSGLSTWAAVGRHFHNIDAFGKAVYGGSRAYFTRKLASVRAKAEKDFRTDAAKASARTAIAAVEEAVRKHGDEASAFVPLERMFANLDRSLLSVALAGKPLIVYRPADPWGDRLEPDALTRPLETIRIKAAVNSRAVYPFVVANLRDVPFLGQLKVFDKDVPKNAFNNGMNAPDGLSAHVSISRGFPIANGTGRPLYDPVEPLQMGTVLRLAGKEFAPVYLELDTRNMKVGTHFGVLALKRATPGFVDERVGVEVEVVDRDLSAVKADKAGYDYAYRSFIGAGRPCRGYVRRLVERGYNVLFFNNLPFYPKMDGRGGWTTDFSSLDRYVDAALSAGLAKESAKLWIYMSMEYGWSAPCDASGRRMAFGSPEWEAGVRALVARLCAHVQERYGIGKDRIWWYPVDEPSGAIVDPSFKSRIARAYHAAKVIKAVDKANLTMVNPLPAFLCSEEIERALPRLAEVYDVFELYRPCLTEKTMRLAKSVNREVWTYSILTKETSAVKYRRDTWENLRDGYREIATFWHMDSCAGGDNFDSTDGKDGHFDDYATFYVDWDHGTSLLSRRQLAADMAFEEARLVLLLRARHANDPERLARIEAIVKQAADIGTMAAMDAAHERLLAFE